MNKNKKDPFDNLILDEYEKEIEDSIPEDMVVRDMPADEKKYFAKIASQHKEFKKSKRINIRIRNEDLAKIKARAKENNVPYQTLLSALIHKYAKDELELQL